MTIEMVKTSNMLKLYLEENNFTINDFIIFLPEGVNLLIR